MSLTRQIIKDNNGKLKIINERNIFKIEATMKWQLHKTKYKLVYLITLNYIILFMSQQVIYSSKLFTILQSYMYKLQNKVVPT